MKIIPQATSNLWTSNCSKLLKNILVKGLLNWLIYDQQPWQVIPNLKKTDKINTCRFTLEYPFHNIFPLTKSKHIQFKVLLQKQYHSGAVITCP